MYSECDTNTICTVNVILAQCTGNVILAQCTVSVVLAQYVQ